MGSEMCIRDRVNAAVTVISTVSNTFYTSRYAGAIARDSRGSLYVSSNWEPSLTSANGWIFKITPDEMGNYDLGCADISILPNSYSIPTITDMFINDADDLFVVQYNGDKAWHIDLNTGAKVQIANSAPSRNTSSVSTTYRDGESFLGPQLIKGNPRRSPNSSVLNSSHLYDGAVYVLSLIHI